MHRILQLRNFLTMPIGTSILERRLDQLQAQLVHECSRMRQGSIDLRLNGGRVHRASLSGLMA